MMIGLAVLTSAILALMGLKLVRSAQERRASRAGYISFGGDDRYQARNVHLNVHDAAMVARIRLDMPADAFEEVVRRVETNYLRWYTALDASIKHRPAVPFDTPLEIRDGYQELQLTDTPLLARIIICRKDRVIFLVGNHVYLGGYLLSQFVQLVFCETVSKGVFPRNRYVPLVSELMILALFGRLMLRPARVESPLFVDKGQLRRLYVKQDLAAIEARAAGLRMHHLYVVIAMHVATVMKHMKRGRLRVTLPVSFEADDSFNTVGAIFLDVEAEPDVETLAKKLKRLMQRKRWQVSASNHVQRIFPTRRLSEKARNTVDLTLTVVPQKTLPHNLLAKELTDYEFTMDNIQYPVYVMAFIFEGHVHSSYMVNTPDFDVEAFIAQDGAKPMHLSLARDVGPVATAGAPQKLRGAR